MDKEVQRISDWLQKKTWLIIGLHRQSFSTGAWPVQSPRLRRKIGEIWHRVYVKQQQKKTTKENIRLLLVIKVCGGSATQW